VLLKKITANDTLKGQRYTVVVNASQDTGNFWIRTVPATGCNKFYDTGIDNKTAIVKYDNSSSTCPDVNAIPNPQNASCTDIDVRNLHPIVPWYVDKHPQNNVTRDTFFARIESTAENPDNSSVSYAHWLLQEKPLWLNWTDPTILNVQAAIDDPYYVVIDGMKTQAM
jgi:hypothetical protein